MLLLKNAYVYTPEDIGINDILIYNDKIISVAEKIEENDVTALFTDIQTIDLAGKTVVPGIIDPHVHITGGGGEASFGSRIAEVKADRCFKMGVTTVIGTLGTDSRTRTVANVVAKARGLTQDGLTAYCLTGAYEVPSPSLMETIGDDIVFIPEVLGVKIAISDHRCSNPTEEELTKLASQARIASLIGGKPGIVHLHTGTGKKGLKTVLDVVENTDIPIAHFVPTHIRNNTPYAEEFVKSGGCIDITSGNIPLNAVKRIKHFLNICDSSQITVSSDGNGSMPIWDENKVLKGYKAAKLSLIDFVREMVNNGFSLEQALPFVTENTAKRWHLYPQKGTIRVDSDADMLVLNSDLSLEMTIAKGKIRYTPKK